MSTAPEPYMEINAELGARKVTLMPGDQIILRVKDLTIGEARFTADLPALLVVKLK